MNVECRERDVPAMPGVTLHLNCPICESARSVPHRFSRPPWSVVRCVDCGMVYLENAPDQSALLDTLAWEATAPAERQRRRGSRGRLYYVLSDSLKSLKSQVYDSTRAAVSLIETHARPGNVLDLGCGSGRLLTQLPAEYVPYGIEPSPAKWAIANAYAETRGGHVLRSVTFPAIEAFTTGEFTAVVAKCYLEHEIRVNEVCRQVHRVLRSGGMFLICVPNVACWNASFRGHLWPGVRLPDHVHYFRAQDLVHLLTHAGFERVMMPLTYHLPSSDNMWALAVK